MRVAIVDLGTNTCRLFLAEVSGGVVRPALRLTTVVRLGEGVAASGDLLPEAVNRTRDCLSRYVPRVEAYRPSRRLLIATSAVREADGGRRFLREVGRDFDLPWRMLSGEEEGALSFRGGTAWLSGRPVAQDRAARRAAGSGDRLLLVDIGGGSSEFAVGTAGERPVFVRSLALGVVRLTERFIHTDPPRAEDLGALARHVSRAIEDDVPQRIRTAVGRAVGVAGTYTTLVANKLGMTAYDATMVQGHVLSSRDIDAALERLVALDDAARRRLPGIQPGREDVIIAGALIAREVLDVFGLDAVSVSEADLLEGAALALADGSLTSS